MHEKLHPALRRIETLSPALNRYSGGDLAGAFVVPSDSAAGMPMLRMVSSGPIDYIGSEGWEHVSVSLENRCPTWDEMCQVKSMFWRDDECVIQFHPPEKDYVRTHPYVLHLWKPPYPTPLPPRSFV